MEEHKESKETKEHHAKEDGSRNAGKTEIKITVPEIKGINWATITTAAAIILLLVVSFQAYQGRTLTQKVNALEAKAAELSKLPVIEVTAIEADCAQCAPLATILGTITPAQANITKTSSLQPADAASQQLITKYSIKHLPTVIVTGEIAKLQLSDQGFETSEDALIYNPAPPYVDAATGAVKGLVTLAYVNASSCSECSDLMPAVQQLSSLVKVTSVKVVDKDSAEGAGLIAKYSMAKLPGILISSDIAEYPIASQLAQAGTVEKDGVIALGANPPYLNLSTGKVAGIASLTMLNDSSCTGCYNVMFHSSVVNGYGVYLSSTKVVDASSAEGKSLISKYKIIAVPTILMAGDLAPYAQLNAIWKTVGTVESDGTYVFRAMSAIAGMPYKNLTTGKVEANAAAQAPAGQ